MQELKIGSLLDHGKYQVLDILGQGGFGITYLVKDRGLEKLRAIKEFYPRDFCDRDPATGDVKLGTKSNSDFIDKLKAKFIKEARNIASLDQHQGIVKIHSVFLGYNTAYYVMDFIDGEPLSYLVSENGPMPLKQAIKYVTQVGEALEYVHSHHINHLDIKPANIMIREKDDRPILIDFGLSKQYDSKGNETSSTPTGISHGYAPLEQYKSDGITEFSPQTDVYSLAATLFFILTGEVPPAATDLIENPLKFPASVPEYIQKAIQKGMASGRKNRHETISHFLRAINRPPSQNKGKIIAVSVESDNHIESDKAHSQQSRALKSEGVKTQKDPSSQVKQQPQKVGSKPAASQTQSKVQPKQEQSVSRKPGISQPQTTGNQKAGVSQPQTVRNQKAGISQPQTPGNRKPVISQTQTTGTRKPGISQPTQPHTPTSTQTQRPTQSGPSNTQTQRHPNTTTSQPRPVGPMPQKPVQSPTHPSQQKNNSRIKEGNNQRPNANQTGQRPPQTIQNQSGQNQPPRKDPYRMSPGGPSRPQQAPRRINFDTIIDPKTDRFDDSPILPPVQQKNNNYEFLFIGGLVVAVIVIIIVIFAFMRGSSDYEETTVDTITVEPIEEVTGVYNDPSASMPDSAVIIQTELNKLNTSF